MKICKWIVCRKYLLFALTFKYCYLTWTIQFNVSHSYISIHLLYNCGMIFFILSFFIGYILSFALVRLWTVRLLVQVFTLTHEGCDNHKCHNKNPRWKMGKGCGWRHARKWGAGNFGDFWKKAVSWDLTLDRPASWGLTEGWCRNSQHSKNCVSLSSCRKPKSQKS